MVSPGNLSSIVIVKSVFYTQALRLTGSFRSLHSRFSDAINSSDYDHFLFHDVIIEPIRYPGGPTAVHTAANLAMKRQGVVLAIPNEARAGREQTASQQGMRVDRQAIQVYLEVPPFQVYGQVHVTPGVDLLTHVFQSPQLFMPVTNVEIVFEANTALNFTTPFLLVNRAAVNLAVDTALMDLTGAAPAVVDRDIARPTVSDERIHPEQAAELLAATTVFGVVDRTQLQQMMAKLVLDQLIVRRQITASAEVFHQGDVGDTMYIVEEGQLEVLLLDTRGLTHRVAEFKGGDFFGEMAVLGDRRRTATVRSVSDARLVAIHEEAVKALMQKFPGVARSLLSIIVQRQAANQQRNAAAR